MIRRAIALSGLLVAAACGTTAPAPAAPLPVSVQRNLPYADGAVVDDRQCLDLYLPEGAGPWPALLWIHGGAWAVGHRKDEEAVARRFAEQGIVVAAIDHRMSKALWIDPKLDTGIQHPEHVKDCAAAFAWLCAHASRYRLDPDRLFVGGFSSGAHLAALLATDPSYLAAHGIDASRIAGAIPVDGAYDMAAYYEAHRVHNGEKMAEQHVLDVFGRGEGVLDAASPTTHLGETKVPMLVLAGLHTMVYTSHLQVAADEKGIDRIRFLHFPDRPHAAMYRSLADEAPDEARTAIVEFIRSHRAESGIRVDRGASGG